MGGLVEQLQSAASDANVSVSELLRKAAIVASKLGVREIDDWLQRERNGYEKNSDVPEYRRLRAQLQVRNPYQGLQPFYIRDANLYDKITRADIIQKVGELEHVVRQQDGVIHYDLPPAIAMSLMNAMQVRMEPVLVLDRAAVIGVLDAVRNAVLDWALALERKGVVGSGMSFSSSEKVAAAQVSYTTINNIGVMANSQLQQHSDGSTQSIQQGFDVAALGELVEGISKAIENANIVGTEKAELVAELQTLRSQAASPNPKHGIIAEALKSVRQILEGAGGNILATYAPQISALLSAIAT
jgi:hypothetical protein